MAKFDMTDIICECEKVTLGEIIYAIKEKNSTTLEKVIKLTSAGNSCRCCISKEKDFNTPRKKIYIKDIMKKII